MAVTREVPECFAALQTPSSSTQKKMSINHSCKVRCDLEKKLPSLIDFLPLQPGHCQQSPSLTSARLLSTMGHRHLYGADYDGGLKSMYDSATISINITLHNLCASNPLVLKKATMPALPPNMIGPTLMSAMLRANQ